MASAFCDEEEEGGSPVTLMGFELNGGATFIQRIPPVLRGDSTPARRNPFG